VVADLALEEQIDKNTKQSTKCQDVVSLSSKMTPSFTIHAWRTRFQYPKYKRVFYQRTISTTPYKAMAGRGVYDHVLFPFHVSEGRHVTLRVFSLFKGQ
jgi:hypothetical protein